MPEIFITESLYPVINGKRKHTTKVGIQEFVAVDGEGVNDKPNKVIKICDKCEKEIKGTKISVDSSTFYHPKCYYKLNEKKVIEIDLS